MVKISVDIAGTTGSTLSTVKAHVHTERCEAASQGGPHYLYNPLGLDSGVNVFEVTLPFDGASSKSTGNVTRPYLARYDQAASIVLHLPSGARFACCNLVPNLPGLPDTWSAVIEANIKQPASNVSYTMLRKEWYHKGTNNLRIDEVGLYTLNAVHP